MASKYDPFWRDHLPAIHAALAEAHNTGARVDLDMSAIQSNGKRETWVGKVAITDDTIQGPGSSAHLRALRAILLQDLPDWADDTRITITMDNDMNLHVQVVPLTDTADGLDIAARLQQWIQEATDPQHPNHVHANLDDPGLVREKIEASIHKLRTDTENFTESDVVDLFGLLNSGGRMKNKVAQNNALPALRQALLDLVDGDGDPAARIKAAVQQIRYAGIAMLGELLGWVHADTTPLVNHCAVNALTYLGYSVEFYDYSSFLAAHADFAKVYQEEVGHLHPDLPLNLEIDKFYNVIDKVDRLNTPQPQPATDRRYWRITLPEKWKVQGPDGEMRQLNVWQDCLTHGLAAVHFDGNTEDFQVKKFMELAPGDGVVAFLQNKTIGGLGVVTHPYDADLFAAKPADQDYWDGVLWFRVNVQWHPVTLMTDDLPKAVANKFLGQTILELTAQDFATVIDTAGLDPADFALPPEPPVSVEPAFPPATFDLLARLHANPTADFYQSNKADFQELVEAPFKSLLADVAAKLPPAITEVMETRKRVVAKILKNDYGQGGAWDYYWGAFYPKGSKRSQDAQLSAFFNRDYFEFGFYFGDYGDAKREHFIRNCISHQSALSELFAARFAPNEVIIGARETFIIDPAGHVTQKPEDVAGWADFFADPARFDCDVSVALHRDQQLALDRSQLIAKMADIYTRLFPLVLLTVEKDPMPAIRAHLQVEEDTDGDDLPGLLVTNPPYPLAALAADTGFADDLLQRWVRAIERKGQAIIYGPPGTGKTFIAEALAQHLIGGGDGFYELLQFHPAYAYEDFIQGIRPGVTQGQLRYDLLPGRFLEFCRRAEQCEGTSVLIIDEINRANLARVFGELMYLLEYRDREIPLAGGESLRIPSNVRIIGTMNTADRSIALVDHALRRRFAFLHLQPDAAILRHFHARHATGFPLDGLIDVLSQVNRAINDPHYALGITFFLRIDLPDQLADIWQMEIEPYLEEYFFDRPEALTPFTWETIRPKLMP